jgi:hypothetical protein
MMNTRLTFFLLDLSGVSLLLGVGHVFGFMVKSVTDNGMEAKI